MITPSLKCKCLYCGVASLFDIALVEWPSQSDIQLDGEEGITLLSLCRRAAGNNPAHLPHDFYYFWLMHNREGALVDDSGQSLMAGFDVPVKQEFVDWEKLRKQRKVAI